jgi:hypothetical protein
VSPRESIAHETPLVTRQGILRRFHRQGIETVLHAEPVWSDAFEEEARLEVANVYTGARHSIADVAFFAYATPRAPDDALAAPLRDAGVPVHLVGDCRVARGILAATAEGHSVGNVL